MPAGESRYRKWEMQVHSTQNMVQVAGCGDPFPLFIPKFDIIRSGSLLEPKEPSVEADGVNIIGEFSTLGQKSAETWTVKLKHQ